MFKNLFTNLKNKNLFLLLLLLFFTVLSRLYILLDSNIFIDGDEAIFGRMVIDFINNKQLPIFFYGQGYGFVFFEVLLSAIFYIFFGASIFTMKVSMLVFWLGSIVVLYYIAKKFLYSRSWAFLSVILVSSIPVWLDWSMKARGGYLTSLLLSNIVIYLSILKRTPIRIIGIFVSLVIIYYAQPLWLVILLPFIAYYLLHDFKIKDFIFSVFSVTIIYYLLSFLLSYLNIQFQVQNRLGLNRVTENIRNIFDYYLVGYSGSFFDSSRLDINVYLKIVSIVFLVTLIVTILYNLYLTIRKKNTIYNNLLLSAVLLYISFMLFYNEQDYGYRFLLPVFIPAMILIVLTWKKIVSEKYEKYLYIGFIFFAVISSYVSINSFNYLYPSHNDGVTEVQRMDLVKNYLNVNDVKCVYGLDWLISQHVFYFMPDVASRHQDIDPRRPEMTSQVDGLRESESCALIGLWYHLPLFINSFQAKDIMIIGSRYIVKIDPSKESLINLNFNLTD